MSIEKENIEGINEKSSILSKIKFVLGLILLFLFVIFLTFAILYFANPKAKQMINREVELYKAQKELKSKSGISESADERISKLAKYYLEMDNKSLIEKLSNIKKSNKKVYNEIISSMRVMSRDRTGKIEDAIKRKENKKDIIKEEYDNMLKEEEDKNNELSKYYQSLGTKGAINAIENELKETMNYDKVSAALNVMKPDEVAKIMYYMNPIYTKGIINRFDDNFLNELDKEKEKYLEFLRKNISIGKIYNSTDEKIAEKELSNDKKYSNEALGVIFSTMDYLQAGKILNEFEDEDKAQLIIENMKNIEDLENNDIREHSEDVSKSIKVLKNYNRDVDILKEAYDKMESESLAEVLDNLIVKEPNYKIYKISPGKTFKISEREMAIEALKRMKPKKVGEILTELKNNDKADKASYISREIGIPNP